MGMTTKLYETCTRFVFGSIRFKAIGPRVLCTAPSGLMRIHPSHLGYHYTSMTYWASVDLDVTTDSPLTQLAIAPAATEVKKTAEQN